MRPVLALASIALLLNACIGEAAMPQTFDQTENETPADVDAFIDSIPDLDLAPVEPKSEIPCEGACPGDSQEGDLACSYTRFTETEQYDQFVAFQPNSATLWPGTVVRGADAEAGVLTPIGVELAPVTFSLSLENIAASPVGTMEKPTLSAFRDARNQILSQGVTGATPASLDFEVIEVNSSSQLSLALGANVSWPGGADIAASFGFDSSSRKTKILVNFTQAYYTVDVDTHLTPSDFFVNGTTVEDLEPWIGTGSPPLYVQSITYGRRVIFSIQTEASASEVKAALEASYGNLVEAGISVSTEHKKVLSESTIRAFVLGGSGEDATGAINGFDGLVDYIQRGGSYSPDSPGAAIAYKLAYLDNAVTRLAFTTDYAERTCVKNLADLTLDLTSLKHVSGGDAGGNIEFYGQVLVRYPTPGSPVKDCNEGGALASVWTMPDGSWVSMPEGSTWTPSAPVWIAIDGVPVEETSRICVIADMWEEDGSTTELSGDDDYGIAGLLLEFGDGWAGEHHIVTQGTGTNSVDVGVKIDVK